MQRRLLIRAMKLEGRTCYDMAKELGINIRTIMRDLDAIGDEIYNDVSDNAFKKSLRDFILNFDETLREKWKLYKTVESEGIRAKLLDSIETATEKRIQLLQSVGLVKNAAPAQDIVVRFLRPGEDKKGDKK